MKYIKRWLFDWIERNEYPMYVKGRTLADVMFLEHPILLAEKTGQGVATLIGKLMSNVDELGYEKNTHGKNGFIYVRRKVILRDEFNPEVVSV